MVASTLRSKYRKALRFIKQNYLKWIPYDHTPPDPIPEFPEEMFFGRCPDLHTLLQSLSLFTAIRQLFHFTGKALPCCKSLHSFIVATWNLMKTPIDTTSHELMYIHPAALRHRTSELVLWERLLMITWLGIHQLVGVGSISETSLEPGNSTFKSLTQLRAAFRRRGGHTEISFKKFVATVLVRVFRVMINEIAGVVVVPAPVLMLDVRVGPVIDLPRPADGVARRERIVFWNSPEGISIRDSQQKHAPTGQLIGKHDCVMCGNRRLIHTPSCLYCKEFLCVSGQPNCWEVFHSSQRIVGGKRKSGEPG
jgi:hypothetical protein